MHQHNQPNGAVNLVNASDFQIIINTPELGLPKKKPTIGGTIKQAVFVSCE